MPNPQIQTYATPGGGSTTIYTLIWNSLAQIWNTNTSAFEAYNTANLAVYAVFLSEKHVGCGWYTANMPSGITTPDNYTCACFSAATPNNPLEGDVFAGVWNGAWTGSAWFPMNINLAQTYTPSDNTETIGGALAAARAQGFGKWVISGTTLTLYAADGVTAVRTFTLDSATAPTQRV